MKDVEIIALMTDQIEVALVAASYNYLIVQSNQPTQQGTPTQSTIFFHKLFEIPYGFPATTQIFNSVNQILTETTEQLYESHWQISALVNQVPGDTTTPTASDVVNYIQLWLSSRTNLRTFVTNGMGMFRIRRSENQYFDNDKSQYQAMPNFEIIFSHKNSVSSSIPFVTTVDGKSYVI